MRNLPRLRRRHPPEREQWATPCGCIARIFALFGAVAQGADGVEVEVRVDITFLNLPLILNYLSTALLA